MIRSTLLTLASLLAVSSLPAFALDVGDEVTELQLRDANDKPAAIPDLGKKVIAIFYTDADVADMNDPLADALKERKPDLDKYRPLGIVNLKDSFPPNFIIRAVVRGKIEKYKSIILTDPAHLLPDAWGLGTCQDTSVIIVIGKDKKIKHLQRGAIRGKDITTVVDLIFTLMNDV